MLRFATGLLIGPTCATAAAQMVSKVNTNGVLQGYVVQKDGKEACRDPNVWVEFRGPESYIVCPE